MNWKPGDMAIIVNCQWWHHCGETATLIRRDATYQDRWILDLPPEPPHVHVRCPEIFLKPIPPDDEEYDGHEVTSWDNMKDIYVPKELVYVLPN